MGIVSFRAGSHSSGDTFSFCGRAKLDKICNVKRKYVQGDVRDLTTLQYRRKMKTHSGYKSVMKHVGKLNAKKRSSIPTSEFGLPGSRKYPMPDRSHAANAKARATQMVNAGKLSPASASKIKAKANRVLGKRGK